MPTLTTVGAPDLDSLFNTTPVAQPTPPKPVKLDPQLKVQLLGRIQAARAANHGYPPPNLDATKRGKLEAAIESGQAVVAPLNANVSVILKKAELDEPASFFYRTTGGFAGTQYFGPLDA